TRSPCPCSMCKTAASRRSSPSSPKSPHGRTNASSPNLLGWQRANPASSGNLIREETMADLIYAIIASLDGYIADEDGKFDWAAPSQELHAYFNDLQRSVGTELYGRRMYETMRVWGTLPLADLPPVEREFAELWRATDKVVYSSSLEVSAPRTRVERAFDPAAVRAMKAAAGRDLSIGGAALAA